MTPDGIGTLKQYADAHRDTFLAANPGAVTQAEYDRLYPVASRHGNWVNAIFDAVRAGRALSRYTLDDLFERDSLAYWSCVHDYPDNLSIRYPAYVHPELSEQFRKLSDRWHDEADLEPAPSKKLLNTAYLQIIALGPQVVPHIIDDLATRGGDWFLALRVLTSANPVPDEETHRPAMKAAWLEWARDEKGLRLRAEAGWPDWHGEYEAENELRVAAEARVAALPRITDELEAFGQTGLQQGYRDGYLAAYARGWNDCLIASKVPVLVPTVLLAVENDLKRIVPHSDPLAPWWYKERIEAILEKLLALRQDGKPYVEHVPTPPRWAITQPEDGCPCALVTPPCNEECTCANQFRSGGCSRCARYGSFEQRITQARAIADRDDALEAVEGNVTKLQTALRETAVNLSTDDNGGAFIMCDLCSDSATIDPEHIDFSLIVHAPTCLLYPGGGA